MALPNKYQRSDDLISWLALLYDEISTAITNIATNLAAITKVNAVVDLTSAVADYSLSVNETAKINITAASTPLNIAVEDGVYEVNILFDNSTFAAGQPTALNPNNTTYANGFSFTASRADVGFATDEIDVTESTAQTTHVIDPGSLTPRQIEIKLTIFGTISSIVTTMHCNTSANNRIVQSASYWNNGVVHSSLGTLSIVEAATGVCYVKRLA